MGIIADPSRRWQTDVVRWGTRKNLKIFIPDPTSDTFRPVHESPATRKFQQRHMSHIRHFLPPACHLRPFDTFREHRSEIFVIFYR